MYLPAVRSNRGGSLPGLGPSGAGLGVAPACLPFSTYAGRYLAYGITEGIREAQDGGAGLIIYYRKEGRSLGEVTK